MTLFYRNPHVRLYQGDCVELLPRWIENVVHSVVTDVPYELGFMGKKWDRSGVSFQKETWEEVFRVLKPGGYLLAFGGTRTQHRIACAIEDAGFEIRDCIMWITGQGFPKSLSIGKALDKAAGAEREGVGINPSSRPASKKKNMRGFDNREEATEESAGVQMLTAPSTPEAKKWDGWGTSLKPAHEPIIVARKPLIGTVAQNVLEHGTGGLNIDGCRVDAKGETWEREPGTVQPNDSIGTFKTGTRSVVQNSAGRWPANVIFSHHPDCKLVGYQDEKGYTINRWKDGAKPFGGGAGHEYEGEKVDGGVREVWECVEGCPVKELDEQSGISKSTGGKGKKSGLIDNADIYGKFSGENKGQNADGLGDSGGASRFFYQAKASGHCNIEKLKIGGERHRGCEDLHWLKGKRIGEDDWMKLRQENIDRKKEKGYKPHPIQWGNIHPTVKPLALMRYLARLVTPPGGVILDPFVGSGTTVIAALQEGFNILAIDRESEYLGITQQRIAGIP